MLDFDNRPWGRWEEYLNEPEYRVKRLVLHPEKRFSLQRHMYRAERWIVVSGSGSASIGDEVLDIKRGDVVRVEPKQLHRLKCTGRDPLVIIEVQIGICQEDDIERIEDDWGRV